MPRREEDASSGIVREAGNQRAMWTEMHETGGPHTAHAGLRDDESMPLTLLSEFSSASSWISGASTIGAFISWALGRRCHNSLIADASCHPSTQHYVIRGFHICVLQRQ